MTGNRMTGTRIDTGPAHAHLNVDGIREHFAILRRTINGSRLAYLDSAGSSQKPSIVLDAMTRYYETSHANVNRGAYTLAAEADAAYEGARTKVATFIGAHESAEIIFTKNATESINLVAHSWGTANLNAGDVVVLTEMEHHANIVPWHQLAAARGIVLRFAPITDDGLIDETALTALLDSAKLFSFTAMSNVLGTITPVQRLTKLAHDAGALVMIDACQSVPHGVTNVTQLGVDFAVFSGHKMCGPTGIGVLWARRELLDAMPPFLGGGSMISDVRLDGFDTAPVPNKFEAGTPPIAEAVGLGAAVDYLSEIGPIAIHNHEQSLTRFAINRLQDTFGDTITIHGPNDIALADQKGGVLSFTLGDIHPHDLSQVLDDNGVCVRAGHHCAKPLMRKLGVTATARASFYLYSGRDDVEQLVDGLIQANKLFG